MTGHKEEALKWVEYATDLNPEVDLHAGHAVQIAQVHATLALAEQQRVQTIAMLLTSALRAVAENTMHPNDYKAMFSKLNPVLQSQLEIGDLS